MKRLAFAVLVLVGCTPSSPTSVGHASSAAAWAGVAPMLHTRVGHTATLLPSGKVLVVGGSDGASDLSSAEIYDPAANTWTATGSLSVARSAHTATLLSDGRVVVLGGSLSISSAEIFNGSTWSTLGGLASARRRHTATRLGSKILVAGGESGITTAETYDPSTGSITASGTLQAHSAGVALLLTSGKVLLIGGQATVPAGADLYDPGSNTWSSGGTMVSPRFDHAAVMFASGKVLVDGGRGASETASIGPEMYDPTANTWTALSTRGAERRRDAAVVLSGDKALLIGGNSLSTAPGSEIFDPATSTWVSSGALVTPRSEHTAVRLTDGRILVAGGRNTSNAVLSSAELFALQPLGATCTLGGECASGLCVDNVCCNTPCTGQCEACDGATKGTCSPISGAPHGGRTACSGGAGDPCKAQLCDGVDRTACHYPASGAPACSAAACVDGIETHASTCNGMGGCSDVATSCGAYACGTTICKTSCTSATDCAPGARCVGTECVTLPGLGETCTGSSSCTSGLFCVDGVCCGVAACPAGSSCSAGPTKGVCAKTLGTGCTTSAQCGSGHCVDGVCCDSACDGQCEACDIPDATGRKGKCLPVKGAPHAGHPGCTVDTADVCRTATCDGATRTSCAGLVADETSCRAQSCKDGVVTLGASCDGKGGCPTAQTSPCSGFRCDDAGTACRTSCTSAADCIDGFDCIDKTCKRRTATCSSDGKQSIDAAGTTTDCSPYVCLVGTCRIECATSADCQGGTVCQDKRCITPQVADSAEDSGGCRYGRSHTSAEWTAVALLLLGMVRRRASKTLASGGNRPRLRRRRAGVE